MVGLLKAKRALRVLTVFTILTFLPTAAQAWNFLPEEKEQEEGETAREDDLLLASNDAEGGRVEAKAPQNRRSPVGPGESPARAGAPRIVHVAKRTPKLPSGKAILSEFRSLSPADDPLAVDEPKEPEQERILVAQAYELRGPQGPPSAASDLAAADALYNTGYYSDAGIAYLHIIDTYPHTSEAAWADQGLTNINEGIHGGTILQSAVDAFETYLASYEAQTPEGEFVGVFYNAEQAETYKDLGNEALMGTYALAARAAGRSFAIANRCHMLAPSCLEYYYDMSALLGDAWLEEAVDDLSDVVDIHGTATGDMAEASSGLLRLAALDVLITHWTRERNVGMAGHYSGLLSGMSHHTFIETMFNDPEVYNWVKGRIAVALGRAYTNLRKHEEAKEWYQYGVDHTRSSGLTREALAYRVADATARMNPGDHYGNILAYNDVLQNYPASEYAAPRALLGMAAEYFRAEDYATALSFFSEVIQGFPDSDQARVAEGEMDFIIRNLYSSRPVAGIFPADEGSAPVQQAQRCGPEALQKLLAQNGIEATIEDLAELAGTDDRGTTLSGLIAAAKEKGLSLEGVRVEDVADLAPPFIAHVKGDHFVLVTRVDSDAVVVEDGGLAAESMPRAAFEAMWSGTALVKAPAAQVAQALDEAFLDACRGGNEPGDPYWTGEFPDSSDPYRHGHSVEPPDPDPNKPESCQCETMPTKPCSPQSWVGFSSPGANPTIDGFLSRMFLGIDDLSMEIAGPLRLAVQRTYMNDQGFHRTGAWSVGKGWTHNFHPQSHMSAEGTVMITTSLDIEEGDSYVTLTRAYTIGTHITDTNTRTYVDPGYDLYEYPSGQTEAINPPDFSYTVDGVEFFYQPTEEVDYFYLPHDRDPVPPEGMCASDTIYYRLSKIRDATGDAMTLEYDGSGTLTKVMPRSGDSRNLRFYYDGSDMLTKAALLRDASNVIQDVEYEYNGDGELTKVTDAANKTVTYAYASDGAVTGSRYISSITDKRGEQVTFTYAYSGGEATKITATLPNGLTSEYERSLTTDVATLTNKDGATQLSKIVNTPVDGDLTKSSTIDYYLGTTNYQRWTYQYDGDLLTKTLAPGDVAYLEYEYNEDEQVTKTRTGTGPWTTYSYASSEEEYPTKMTDPAGLDTVYSYDGSGRLTRVTHPSVAANGIEYTYNGNGDVSAVEDPLGNSTSYAYDARGNMTSVTDPTSNTTTFVYDDLGNMTQVTNPRSKSTTFYYAYGGCGGCGQSGGIMTKVKDALNNETEYAYNANGNMTTVTDALDRQTSYEYDTMNRVTKVVSPSGGANYMQYTYDKLGRMITQRDFEGKNTTMAYDHVGRVTSQTDPVGSVSFTYDALGALSTVTDGLSQTTDSDYDSAFRLTKVTDAQNKVTRYLYDSAGRMSKVGATSDGSVDPTEYFFHATTGLATKVRYTSGENTYDATYEYDGGARLTALKDWIDDTDGLRYAYDDAGRLTQITDYDDSTLDYTYDAAGNVLTMDDYHSHDVVYTYTDTNQVSTITAPGSRTWDYDYNALGQPTQVSIPNGMTTAYSYDNRNQMTKIEHKDGESVLDGFTYTLSAGSNIVTTAHADGAEWAYEYDGRYRLTKAERDNDGDTITATYEYTYDDGDNLITKVEPFFDDFNDTNYTGWSSSSSWSASNGYMERSSGTTGFYRSNTDADLELWFSYCNADTSSNDYASSTYIRYSSPDYVRVWIAPDRMRLLQKSGEDYTTLASNLSATTTQDVWYDVHVVCDDSDITVWRCLVSAHLGEFWVLG